MAYILDQTLEKVQIAARQVEWYTRYPIPGPNDDYALNIVNAWRDGKRRLLPEEVPHDLILEKPRKSWPDMFRASAGMTVVRQPVKEAIERLDPDIHQFWPITVHTKRGIEIDGPWFGMNVTVRQDSIQFIPGSGIRRSEEFPDKLNKISYEEKDVTVDPSKLGAVNLWREQRFIGSLLASDALIAAFKEAGLKTYKSFKAKEI